MALVAAPVLEEDGSIREWVASDTDVTDRKESEAALAAARDAAERAQQAAEEANLAKSTFIANMSHELRTPLSAIIGYSEMMLEEIEDGGDGGGPRRRHAQDRGQRPPPARPHQRRARPQQGRERQDGGLSPKTFDVAAVLRDVAATVESLVDKKGNTLELQLAPDLGTMHSDVTKVRQMLLNLLSNAAKFTEGGTITLAAARGRAAGRRLAGLSRCRDTGIGMTRGAAAPSCSSASSRPTPRRRASSAAPGLGLSLTKAFADMLGGDVDGRERAGQGSTFAVRLPAVLAAELGGRRTHGRGAPARPRTRTARDLVLVIDDDAGPARH